MYTHTMEYYTIIEKNEIMPFAAMWMHLEIIIVSEVNQRQISYDIAYMQSLKKMIQMNLFAKQTTHRLRNEHLITTGKWWGEGINWEAGIDMFTLLYLK